MMLQEITDSDIVTHNTLRIKILLCSFSWHKWHMLWANYEMQICWIKVAE